MQPFDQQWLQSDLALGLQLSLHFDFESLLGTEGPVLDRVEGDHWKPGSVPAGPAGAFGGAREETPHLASGKTRLTKENQGPNECNYFKQLTQTEQA